jgi:hypothetical protein
MLFVGVREPAGDPTEDSGDEAICESPSKSVFLSKRVVRLFRCAGVRSRRNGLVGEHQSAELTSRHGNLFQKHTSEDEAGKQSVMLGILCRCSCRRSRDA